VTTEGLKVEIYEVKKDIFVIEQNLSGSTRDRLVKMCEEKLKKLNEQLDLTPEERLLRAIFGEE